MDLRGEVFPSTQTTKMVVWNMLPTWVRIFCYYFLRTKGGPHNDRGGLEATEVVVATVAVTSICSDYQGLFWRVSRYPAPPCELFTLVALECCAWIAFNTFSLEHVNQWYEQLQR